MTPNPVSVLVVGGGSLLARALLALPQHGVSLAAISHDMFDNVDMGAYDVVVNMAYDPRYVREAYDPVLDFDRKVAQAVARTGAHFVLMSSRRVYGLGHEGPISEDAPTCPADAYGRNKLQTERAARELLGDRLTILRLANVFGFEPGRHTFFGIALTSLKEQGRITLDSSPFVEKDFIPLSCCAAAILALLPRKAAGTFNLGYGTATETGRIALWLIEGYGRGELVVSSPVERDGFLLDTSRLASLAVLPDHRMSIRDHCVQIGERLRDADA